MASVTSLDKDLRRLRLDKYTPTAANEARSWIEGALGESLSSSDLLDGLKDGVALCRYVNPRCFHALHNRPCVANTHHLQARQLSHRSPWGQVQEVRHALRPDGKYLTFPSRLPIAPTQHARSRHVLNRRFIRKEGPCPGLAMPRLLLTCCTCGEPLCLPILHWPPSSQSARYRSEHRSDHPF